MHSFRFILRTLVPAVALTFATLTGFAQKTNAVVTPQITLFPACPCYHLLGEGDGATRIDAKITLTRAQINGAVLRVTVHDTQSDFSEVETVPVHQSGNAGVTVHIPVQKLATFLVSAELLDGGGKRVLAKAEATDIKICRPEEARVTIGPDGFLRIAGKAEFPIGLYSSAHNKMISQAGFTVTHNYGISNGDARDPINSTDASLKKLLDASWANGMRMMVEIPRKAVEKAQWEQVKRRIETFRHHPGLLCWDSEERVARGKAPLANVTALYNLAHTLDPDHPFVLGDSSEVTKQAKLHPRTFFPDNSMDIGIWWWYAFPLAKTNLFLQPPAWLTEATTHKPLWIAIQAYTQPWGHSRYPTPAEYRAETYLSLIHGVKGLFFYTGSGEIDVHGKPAGLLNQPENSHWDYVQTLLRELHEVAPIFMAPESQEKIVMSPADAPIDFTTRELNGKFYLFAANKSVKPQSVTFNGSILAKKNLTVLYESNSVTAEGETLGAHFEPLGVHVFEVGR